MRARWWALVFSVVIIAGGFGGWEFLPAGEPSYHPVYVVATPISHVELVAACYWTRIVVDFDTVSVRPQVPTICHPWPSQGGPILEATLICGATQVSASVTVGPHEDATWAKGTWISLEIKCGDIATRNYVRVCGGYLTFRLFLPVGVTPTCVAPAPLS